MLVERLVMRMTEFDVLQTFVLMHETIADYLHFRLVRHGFEIGMEDAAFCVESLAVTIAAGGRVKTMGKFVLGLWRAAGLVLEDNYMVVVESGAEKGEIMVYKDMISIVGCVGLRNTYAGGYRSTECSLLSDCLYFKYLANILLTTEVFDINVFD